MRRYIALPNTNVRGYLYQSKMYCHQCLIPALRSSLQWQFDTVAHPLRLVMDDGDHIDVEVVLYRLAALVGINRFHQQLFDSQDFPKVLVPGPYTDHCKECDTLLTGGSLLMGGESK